MKLSEIKKLHQKKFRASFACYLVEGEHLILELCNAIQSKESKHALTNKRLAAPEITLYVTPENTQWAKNLPVSFTLTEVTEKQMLDMSDTKTPQGMIARVPFSLPLNSPQSTVSHKKAIYLHETQDPGNLGTILRTLAWFGDFRLLLSPNSVDPYNSKVIRASMGAIFHIEIEQDVEISELEKRFKRFAVLDIDGHSITDNVFKGFDCYLFGNEARGVPHQSLESLDTQAFSIAGSGMIDSLNLASAVNICAYELSR